MPKMWIHHEQGRHSVRQLWQAKQRGQMTKIETPQMDRTENTVLNAIKYHYFLHGIPPTIRWISNNSWLKSKSHVHAVLERLEKKNIIKFCGAGDRKPVPVELLACILAFYDNVYPNGDRISSEAFQMK